MIILPRKGEGTKMAKSIRPLAHIDLEYERAAQAYLKSLPLEHFIEGFDQATQREISV